LNGKRNVSLRGESGISPAEKNPGENAATATGASPESCKMIRG